MLQRENGAGIEGTGQVGSERVGEREEERDRDRGAR